MTQVFEESGYQMVNRCFDNPNGAFARNIREYNEAHPNEIGFIMIDLNETDHDQLDDVDEDPSFLCDNCGQSTPLIWMKP